MICSEAGIESTALQSMNILTRNAPGVKNKRSGAIEPRPAPPRAYEPCILWSLIVSLRSLVTVTNFQQLTLKASGGLEQVKR